MSVPPHTEHSGLILVRWSLAQLGVGMGNRNYFVYLGPSETMTIRVRFKNGKEPEEFDVSPRTLSVDSEHGFTALYDTAGRTNFVGGWPTDDIESIKPVK